MNWIQNHTKFKTGWATYNWTVYIVMNSNHFNTGVQLFVDLLVASQFTREGVVAAFFALLVCSGGLPFAVLFTHCLPMLIVYCWLFIGLAVIIGLVIFWARETFWDGEMDSQPSGYVAKMFLSLTLQACLRIVPTTGVMFFLGETRSEEGYLPSKAPG